MTASITRRSLLKLSAGAVAVIGNSLALTPNALANSKESTATAASDSELLELDGLGLARRVRAGSISARELAEIAAARIERLDSDINAVTTMALDRALVAAGKISRKSTFAGVPTMIKDVVDVSGVRRTSGSLINLSHVPAVSVEYVKAMEAAGLNVLGMTNTPEFASLALTDNLAFGPTRNPWALEYSAGGSSGGSAAAVAAGYVPLAHGTDGGGSNRIPASCCGVLGMKASRYRQLSGEPDGGQLFLRTHQCLSRTVRDSAALLAATENRDNAAGYPPVGLVEGPSTRPLRIALSAENGFGQPPQSSVREVLDQTARLCESLGHDVVAVPNPVDGGAMFAALEGIMLAGLPGLLMNVESLTGKRAEGAGILSSALVDLGRYAASLGQDAHEKGLAWWRQQTREFLGFFSTYDVWLTPVMPLETPRNGFIAPDTPFDLARSRNRQLMSYTAVANGIGAPAMSVPLFHSRETGLPVGSHFMAAPGNDRTLYELAYALEAAQPWAGRWAPHSARYR